MTSDPAEPQPTTRPTTVYQYFDKMGRLLYVGVTDRGPERSHEHAATKTWWWHAAGCTIEHLPTREAALAREADLIRRLRPPFNLQHNPTPGGYQVRTTGPAVVLSDATLAARRTDWYVLDEVGRASAMCVFCGVNPSPRRPTCPTCWAERQAGRHVIR